MQLEQLMYQPLRPESIQKERQRVYTIVDLGSLSASALYDLKIVDLRSLGMQMHFHENEKGEITKAKLKSYKGENLRELSNYEAAMGDLYATKMSLPTIQRWS